MRLVLIVNDAASSVTSTVRRAVTDVLADGHDLAVLTTSGRDHATELARQAAVDGVDVVVVLGGDGTLNEVANGLIGFPTAMAALPGGSTNVFARTIGATGDPAASASQLRGALERPSCRRRIGVGTANGRRFLFNVGIGFDAAVVAEVERWGSLKRYAGHALFVVAAVITWIRLDRSRPLLSVHFDDGTVVEGALAICLNSNPYTYFGPRPLNLVPGTMLELPLAVLTFRELSLGPTLGILRDALIRREGVTERGDVEYQTGVRTATVRGHGPVPYQLDGEHLGDAEAVELRYEPDALTIVDPSSEPPADV